MLRLASRIIVVGSIILVLVLVVGGCVLEELQWQQMMHPNWPKQETAGAEVDRAVGAAVDRYEAVLDAQWGDADCVVERCPKSSKSLPGMPQDRAEFTKEERFNLERKAHYLSREPVSSTDLYSTPSSSPPAPPRPRGPCWGPPAWRSASAAASSTSRPGLAV